jgi:DNA-directed RNA polymerase beta subunit
MSAPLNGAGSKDAYGYGDDAYGSYADDAALGDEEEFDSPDDEIGQEDLWDVIRAFFDENGLVQQQLASFNEFVNNTMQELVEEVKSITLEQLDQHTGFAGDCTVSRSSVCAGSALEPDCLRSALASLRDRVRADLPLASTDDRVRRQLGRNVAAGGTAT